MDHRSKLKEKQDKRQNEEKETKMNKKKFDIQDRIKQTAKLYHNVNGGMFENPREATFKVVNDHIEINRENRSPFSVGKNKRTYDDETAYNDENSDCGFSPRKKTRYNYGMDPNFRPVETYVDENGMSCFRFKHDTQPPTQVHIPKGISEGIQMAAQQVTHIKFATPSQTNMATMQLPLTQPPTYPAEGFQSEGFRNISQMF